MPVHRLVLPVSQRCVALAEAMLLQTLACTLMAGRSAADAVMGSGVSRLLIGLLPGGHPLLRGPFFGTVRP